jgi:deazaflavin-dependent oxidoreductase (nitroreductase family)
VIIASKGGAPDHPDWYKNLAANPMCHIQVGKQACRAKARTATAAERPKLWAQLQDIYPPYDDYQRARRVARYRSSYWNPSAPRRRPDRRYRA